MSLKRKIGKRMKAKALAMNAGAEASLFEKMEGITIDEQFATERIAFLDKQMKSDNYWDAFPGFRKAMYEQAILLDTTYSDTEIIQMFERRRMSALGILPDDDSYAEELREFYKELDNDKNKKK